MGSLASFKISGWSQLAEVFPGLKTIAELEQQGELELRLYQILATLSIIFSGFRGVVRSATGSGKTLIAAAISGAMLPKKTLVLIHGKELVSQTYKAFCFFLGKENVGVITSEEFSPGKITVASIDTFGFYLGSVPTKRNGVPVMNPTKFDEIQEKFVKYLENDVDMLMFDEVHHGSADTWQEVGKRSRAFYRVGLSGTPLKHDELSDMLMMSLVGPVVFDLSAPWLQKHGYLAQAELHVKYLDFTTPANRILSWQEARKKLLVQNKERTIKIAEDIVKAINEKRTRLLVLTGNSVELAEDLLEEVEALARPLTRQLGFKPYTMISGAMNAKKVSRAFEDLRKGNVRCVITTKLADEGIDVPDINLLYLVGGGKAYVATVQRIGRGLRVKNDEDTLLVVDYFTMGNKYLEKHDRARLKTYENEDFFREVKLIDAP